MFVPRFFDSFLTSESRDLHELIFIHPKRTDSQGRFQCLTFRSRSTPYSISRSTDTHGDSQIA